MSQTSPSSVGDGTRLARLARWGVPAALVAFAAAWLVVRLPPSTLDVVWAEDGRVFLGEALRRGPLAVLLEPYDGYLHLLPRVVTAIVVAIVPVAAHGVAVAIASVAIVVAISIATYALSGAVVRFGPARVGLAAVPVVLPTLSAEVLGNLANLHTYCMWIGCWILLASPRGRAASIAWSTVLLVCMLTEVQALLLLPLAVAQWRMRVRATWLPLAATLVGAACQVATMVLDPRTGYPSVGLGIPDVVLAWLVQAVLPILSGSAASNAAALAAAGPLVAVVALAPFAVAGVVCLRLGTWRQRGTALALAWLSGGIMAGCVLVSQLERWRYSAVQGEDWHEAVVIFRYGAAAGMYCAALVPLAVGVVVDRLHARGADPTATRASIGAAVVVATTAWMLVQAPLTGSLRVDAPRWSAEVAEGVRACSVGGDAVELEVAPAGGFGGVAELPCATLDE